MSNAECPLLAGLFLLAHGPPSTAYRPPLPPASSRVRSHGLARRDRLFERIAPAGGRGGLRPSGTPARAAGGGYRGAHETRDGIPRRGAVVGRGHGRDALRAVSDRRRATDDLRANRRLRSDIAAGARHAGSFNPHPVGSAGASGAAAGVSRVTRAV